MRVRFYFILPTLILLLLSLVACASGNPNLLGPDVIFHDEFVTGQSGNWHMEGDNLGRTAIVDERLVIELDGSNIMQFATLSDVTFSNFALEVDVRQLKGDLGNSFGVLFRMQDAGRFYRFDITGNGLYMIERRNADGTWTRFVDDWTESPAINQGHNVTNRLRVEANSRNMILSINDIVVQQISDNLYTSGAIALDAGTFVQPEMQVAFDNVVVRQP